jgi:phosphoribosyl-ATP pyrophosphohydrolase
MINNNNFSFEQLLSLVKAKIAEKDPHSYSYKLYLEGVDKICRKVGEEAVEVVVAAFIDEKNPNAKNREELVGEICDLLYHLTVLMAHRDIDFTEVLAELNTRNKRKK